MSILHSTKIIEALVSGDLYVSGMPNPKNKKEFEAWCAKYVQPASLDLVMGTHFWLENKRSGGRHAGNQEWFTVDYAGDALKQFDYWDSDKNGPPMLGPSRYVLGHTESVIGLSPKFAATVMTRSTAGRWGIDTRRSAGFIDPGYRGKITLEIHNDSARLLPITPGIAYCQLVLHPVLGNEEGSEHAYTGHYNVSEGVEWTPQNMLPKPLTK